jgi:hypothetical protein
MEMLIVAGFFGVFILNSLMGWGVSAKKWLPALIAFYAWWILMWAFLYKHYGNAWSDPDMVCKA